MERSAKACTATAGGWIIEDVPHGSFFGEGHKGKVFLACIGWDSVVAHMKFRETDDFKKTIRPLLKDGTVGLSAVHAEFFEG